MEHLGIDIKELKRRKTKAVVIVHDKEEAAGFIAKSESCCHIFDKDDVVTEKCVMIVTSYAKFTTMRETLKGFAQVVVFLDSNPIKTVKVKGLKKFSLCLNREKKSAVLLVNRTTQADQFVSWLEGMHHQRITNLKMMRPCSRLEDLLKSSSSNFNDTIDRIKSPSVFVLSLLRRLSFATESYPMVSKGQLEVPLCVEVSSKTLSLFLRLARSLYESRSEESLKSLLRVMSLNLKIMCKHRVPGISSSLVNKIRDLLLELSGIGQKDKVMKDDQVASLASAALEGALELFLPAPEAQVTFVRHLLRGGRKKLLARVLKHLHDSTQCTFSLVRDVRPWISRIYLRFYYDQRSNTGTESHIRR